MVAGGGGGGKDPDKRTAYKNMSLLQYFLCIKGLQGDVVYLFMSPNAGVGDGCGVSANGNS